MPGPTLTVVTVVFEAEVPLLEVQARSLDRFAADVFGDVIVLDNTRRGLSARQRARLLRAYGEVRSRVRFLRPDDIVTAVPAARGWIVQQVLKLLVHEHVATDFYVVLDAKNHWIRRTDVHEFVNPDGRARGATHSYREHALRTSLVRVLTYMGIDPEPWLDDFPVTHTPVVLETDLVRRMTADVASRGESFAAEFVRADLTEFFLQAAWIIATFGGLDGHLDGEVVRSATIWPGRSSAADFRHTLAEAERLDAPFLSVHRTALARADRDAVSLLADAWVSRGLFRDRRSVVRFVAAYKVRYLATMGARKVREKVREKVRSR